jgi:catechol 2,3-dioxygenase-like lactoylglutathione lyase family enzyme
MADEANIIQITPFIHVADLDAGIAFFTDILGFSCPFRMSDYAYLERGAAGLRMLAHRDLSELGVAHRGFAYYLDVRDVDTLHAELKPGLDTLPAGDVHGPVDQHYGQRELMVRAPDGNLVVFGQAIAGR